MKLRLSTEGVNVTNLINYNLISIASCDSPYYVRIYFLDCLVYLQILLTHQSSCF